MVGRDPSRAGNLLRFDGNREIVERGLRKFEESRLSLRLRGFDAAIALAVEMRARGRRRALHAVMSVVSGCAGRAEVGQRAGAHRTCPSHCNG